MLKTFVKDVKEVPEALREHYTEDKDAGGWVLNADDKDWKSKIDEFRGNNRSLFKKVEELEGKLKGYAGLDPEEMKQLLDLRAKLGEDEESKLLKEGKFDTVFDRRTAKLREDYDKKMKKLADDSAKAAQERDTMLRDLNDVLVERAVTDAVSKVGQIRPGALRDIVLRGRTVWQLDPETRNLVAKDGRGEPVYGKKGQPLTVEEWSEGLVTDAPYFFEPGSGGGSKGSAKSGGNPGGKIIVDGNDPFAMGRHAEAIAKGDAIVK